MSRINAQDVIYTGIKVGLGVAIIPAAATSLIACSKIILINIIADVVVRIFTANTYTMSVHGVSFVAVPLLWKISLATAIIGGTILALSLIAALINFIYEKHSKKQQCLSQTA